MQHYVSQMSISRFLAVALALSFSVSAETFTGRVVAVADGDTLTVLDASKNQHKIRLAGIDAPEKKQAFGNRSKESLSNLAFGKPVTIETEKLDRYGREVGKVLVNGKDVNLVQVERGMAWHYKAYEREQSANDRMIYAAAELSAREAKRGLWRDTEPVAPWEFRSLTKLNLRAIRE
jgi:endonuclease YncB( thermonuclease family)